MTTTCPLLLVVLLVSYTLCVSAYPGGPPISSCYSQTPAHRDPKDSKNFRNDIPPKLSSRPTYSITVNSMNWTLSQKLQIVVKTVGGESFFEGFVIKAIRVGQNVDSDDMLGQFSNCAVVLENNQAPPNPAVRYYSYYPLEPNERNCITHFTEKHFMNLTCDWVAPNTGQGDIQFVATIVRNFKTIYAHVTSPVIPCIAGGTPTTGTTAMSKPPSMLGCGSTKVCVLYPPMCDQRGGCTQGVMFSDSTKAGYITVEFFGSGVDWVGMALNNNSSNMTGGETFVCKMDLHQKKPILITGYNPGYFNLPIIRRDVINKESYFSSETCSADGCQTIPVQSGFYACRFMRPKSAAFEFIFNRVPFNYDVQTMTISRDLTTGLYVQLAQGEHNTGTGMIRQHRHLPLMSTEPIKLDGSAKVTIYFKGLAKNVQIHGTLMTLFWMLLCGFNIIVARHGKPVMKIELCFAKAAWFVIHIVSHILGFLVALAGMAYMIGTLGKWEEGTVAIHGGFGIAAMCLAVINIIMGIFRPDGDHKFRHFFNIWHRWNGMIAFFLAAIAMWIGITIEELRPEFHFWSVIVFSIWTGAQVIFMVAFECYRQKITRTKEVEQEFLYLYNAKYNKGEDSVTTSKDTLEPPPKVKGKTLHHVNSAAILFYFLTVLALSAAFWAGLWLH